MNACIEALLTSLKGTPPQRWPNLAFDKRKALFKEVATKYTSGMFPHETKTFQGISDNSADLQWRRNTVVHGFIKGRSVPNSNSPTGFDVIFYATNRHNGRDIQID